MKAIENRLKKLRDIIEQHNYNYYILDAPTISDGEYDAIFRDLYALETKHPEPAHRIIYFQIETYQYHVLLVCSELDNL